MCNCNDSRRISRFTEDMKKMSDSVNNSIKVINKISEDGGVSNNVAINPAVPKLEEITITKVEYENLKRENDNLQSNIVTLKSKVDYAIQKLDRLNGALIRLQATAYDTKLDLQR